MPAYVVITHKPRSGRMPCFSDSVDSSSVEGDKMDSDTSGSDSDYGTDLTDLIDEEDEDDEEQQQKVRDADDRKSAGDSSFVEKMNISDNDSDSTDEEGGVDRPPEYYQTHVDAVNTSDVVQTDYAASSTRQLDRIEALWYRYCSYMGKPRQKSFKSVTLGDLSGFFTWMLDQRRGVNGRRLRGTKKSTSLETYWKEFRLVFERARRRKIHPRINRQMHKVLRAVATDCGLSNEKREKASMDVADVRDVLQTALTTTDKRFQVGRYRILTCLFLQGGFITANRPAALLSLQYRHLSVTLLRDPSGGPHRILLEFTFEFTKTFLGAKDANTFPIPEIIFDPSLVLSPHVFLLGLMFADGVFLAPNLQSPEDLSKLDIRPGCNSLPIPLDPARANNYLFRRCERGPNGWTTSEDKLPDSTLRPWIKRIGEIAGFLQVARPYCLRYGAGKAFDDSGKVSDALRNLMMQHAETKTFLNHYLSRRVTVDTQAIVRGLAPQDELMRAACRMSRWIDPERPWKLTPEQSSSVNSDLNVVRLVRRRDKLKSKPSQGEEYKELGRQINNARQRLRHALRIRIRKAWDQEQAVKDIERQLSGRNFGVEVKTKLELAQDRTPEHDCLIKSVLSLPGADLDEEVRRRNTAINAVIAYCGVEEGCIPRQKRSIRSPFSSKQCDSLKQQALTDASNAMLEAAKLAVCTEKRPTICFACLGNERLPINERVYSFSKAGDLSKHFKRRHLKHMKAADAVTCPLCGEALEDRTHFQRHAVSAHGTVS